MSSEALTWIAGDASEYSFYSASDADRGIMSIEGIGLPTLEHTGQSFPFLHGMLDIARPFQDRTVLITFQRQFVGRSAWQTGRRALATALNPDLGKGQLKFVDVDGNDWRLDAWVINTPLERRAEWGPFEIRTVLEFWVPWSFWRKAAAETDTDDFNGTTNVDIAVSNDGNMPTIPDTILITGQVTNPLLTIIGTGMKIDLENTIATGSIVKIVCFPPEKVNVTKVISGETWTLKKDLGDESPAQTEVLTLAYGNGVWLAGTNPTPRYGSLPTTVRRGR
ncbi:hypothetical protein LCGC14_2555710 [marine sediment metagenome]|uniref:Uncharacterized protein n=1 Tax=marine sediment metagenome TaxID=412755 RepID=A0A0F9DEN5_9ZZZZ